MSVPPPRRPYALRAAHPIHVLAASTAMAAGTAPVCVLLALLVLGITGYFGGHAAPHREPAFWVVATIFQSGLLLGVVHAESRRLAGKWLRIVRVGSRRGPRAAVPSSPASG